MTTITTTRFNLRVQGLCYDTINPLSGDVQAVGFDLLTINGTIAFDSIDELREFAPSIMLTQIMQALDWQAQLDADLWAKESASLRHWFDSRRG